MMEQNDLPLQRLVRQVRNRMWLAIITRWVGLGLWLSGVLLLTLGLVHLEVRSLPPAVPVLAALLPPLAALAAALALQRPEWAAAARAADHQADAHSLLLTAWDLRKPVAKDEGTTPLIIHQARRQLPAWGVLIGNYVPPQQGRFPTGAAIICCIGLSLFLLPAGSETVDPSSPLSSSPMADIEERNPLTEILSKVEPASVDSEDDPGARKPRLQRSPNTPEAVAGTGIEPSLLHPAFDAMDNGPADRLTRQLDRLPATAAEMDNPLDTPPAGTTPSSGQGSQSSQGDRAGNDGSSSNQDPRETPQIASGKVQEVAMKRTAGQGSGEFVNGRLSAAGKPGLDGESGDPVAQHRPAERPDSLPLVSALSPVQRDYVARYFQRLQSGSKR